MTPDLDHLEHIVATGTRAAELALATCLTLAALAALTVAGFHIERATSQMWQIEDAR